VVTGDARTECDAAYLGSAYPPSTRIVRQSVNRGVASKTACALVEDVLGAGAVHEAVRHGDLRIPARVNAGNRFAQVFRRAASRAGGGRTLLMRPRDSG